MFRLEHQEIKIFKSFQIKTQYVYVRKIHKTKILSVHVYNGLDTGLYSIARARGADS